MADFLQQNYYLLNMFFALACCLGLIIYLARYSPDDRRSRAYVRWLMGVVAWALFDLSVA